MFIKTSKLEEFKKATLTEVEYFYTIDDWFQ